MKAAIYNPYLDTLGGGERYTLAFAGALSKCGYDVDIEWKQKDIKSLLERKFGIKLNKIKIVDDVNRGENYDLIFWVSDGSIPLLKARKNFIHFQIPFTKTNGKSLLNRMKFIRINKVICNSVFTKNFIDREYGLKSVVIYPPVDTDSIKPKIKKNLIISVGRFSQLKQLKHQDILIEIFRNIIDRGLTDWDLILAGGTEVGVDDYLNKLKKRALRYPIKILEKPDFNEIKRLYGQAKIFWSASGFSVDESREPEKVEHFGITVVEAMSAKTVPIVYDAGGHKEIIEDGKNGYLWKKKSELLTKTLKIINEPRTMSLISQEAFRSSKKFSYERFDQEVAALL